jgi:calcineurin-like phosphoesterase family protein
MMIVRWRRVWGACGTALLICACGGSGMGPSPGPGPGPSVGVLVGAGDIGVCGSTGPEATARLLDDIDGTVFTAGDNAYFQGTMQQYRDCYDPSWGRHASRTRPAPGNHEYESPNAAPYFAYFGPNAGPPGLGYYSFSVGEWHIVSLNSSVSMTPGSAQQTWLRSELASRHAACVAAIWHHPLFSVGPNGPMPETRELWRTLYDAGADVIINAHDHFYARFAPQTPDGVADSSRGIRQFVVGTGGAQLVGFTRGDPNVQARVSTFGVLKLTLRPGSYDWQFIAANSSQSDSGSDVCR